MAGDSDMSKLIVGKFKGENYHLWKFQMTLMLKGNPFEPLLRYSLARNLCLHTSGCSAASHMQWSYRNTVGNSITRPGMYFRKLGYSSSSKAWTLPLLDRDDNTAI